jgi:predicted nucleotidyltransferase
MGGREVALAADFRDLLRAFVDHEVRFLVVGAYALAVLGRPRATGDLDLWVDATSRNAARVHAALGAFGAPLRDVTVADLAVPGLIFQIGLPPLRIDILTEISGVSFPEAWRRRVRAIFEGVPVWVIGLRDFVANKRATGRLKDLADVEALEGESKTGTRPRRRSPVRRTK